MQCIVPGRSADLFLPTVVSTMVPHDGEDVIPSSFSCSVAAWASNLSNKLCAVAGDVSVTLPCLASPSGEYFAVSKVSFRTTFTSRVCCGMVSSAVSTSGAVPAWSAWSLPITSPLARLPEASVAWCFSTPLTIMVCPSILWWRVAMVVYLAE